LARCFPEHTDCVLTCIQSVKNFAYIFQREGVSIDMQELMESKLIDSIPCIPQITSVSKPHGEQATGFEILDELLGYHQGKQEVICEEINMIFSIYGGDEFDEDDLKF